MPERLAPRVVFVGCLVVLGTAAMAGVAQTGPQAQGQTGPRTGTGLIIGRLVDAVSGKPIPGAIVDLTVTPPGTTDQGAGPGVIVIAGPRSGATQTSVVADIDGEFAFRDLPAGKCRFNVEVRGYSGGGYNQSQPDGTPQMLDLADGQHVNDVTLRMWKDGILTGRVIDEAGEPVVGVFVRVLRRVVAGGQATFRLSGGGNETDDRGIYRSAGLPPGDYVVEVPITRTTMPIATFDALQVMEQADPAAGNAMRALLDIQSRAGVAESGQQVGNLLVSSGNVQGPQGTALTAVPAGGGRLATYPTVFYPSATISTRATVVTLKAGDEKTGIDIALLLAPAFRVSGVLTGMDGRAAPSVAMRLTSLDDQANVDSAPDDVATTMSGPNGEFTLLAVPVGQYQLMAVRRPPAGARAVGAAAPLPSLGPPGWAKMPVTVSDSDVTGLALNLKAGLSVTGRVVFEGQSQLPNDNQLTRGIRLDAVGQPQGGAAGAGLVALINTDGTFSMTGALPGRYTLTPAGWPLLQWKAKSVIADGRDISDTTIDLDTSDLSNVTITFTDKPASITGLVHTTSGAADPNAIVVGFPADPRGWVAPALHVFTARASTGGSYSVAGAAPGDYLIAAIPESLTASWKTYDMLQRIAPSAVRLKLDTGAHLTQDLTTMVVR